MGDAFVRVTHEPMRTPVHIVAGPLGAGKTTLVRAWMAAHAGTERSAVIVNDFGEAAFDAAILGDGAARVTNIPGGCVCCTAPAGLAQAVALVLDEVRPDRLFIEPSGLARPQDVVDMLSRGAMKERAALGPTVVVADPGAPDSELLASQLAAADILVINRIDLSSTDTLDMYHRRLSDLWPGPLRVFETERGVLPEGALDWPGERPPARFVAHSPGPSTAGFSARSWTFGPEVTLGWDPLRAAVKGVTRFKGLLHTDIGWIRADVVNGGLQIESTGWRRDSRADVIVADGTPMPDLSACVLADDAAPTGDALALVDPDGFELRLTREGLSGLPGQVPDVGVVAPGRAGAGVVLREVLTLARGDSFTVIAADGMTSGPIPFGDVGGAVLAHSLGDGPLPPDQGGPFRLYGAGTKCGNVKGVVRIRVRRG